MVVSQWRVCGVVGWLTGAPPVRRFSHFRQVREQRQAAAAAAAVAAVDAGAGAVSPLVRPRLPGTAASSSANQRLAAQMESRPSVLAALRGGPAPVR